MSLDAPDGWARSDARLAPPELAPSPKVTVEDWRVFAPARGNDATMVAACFRGGATGWLPEADAIALQKLEAVAASTYLRLGVEGGFTSYGDVTRDGPVRTRTLDGPAHARTFLAFDAAGGVHGCFALCARASGSDRAACAAAVDASKLEGAFVEAPAPTAWMRALAWAVHHPGGAAATVALLAVFLGALAVVTRRRPRHRP